MKSIPAKICIADDNEGDRYFFREAIEEINPGIALLEADSGDVLLKKLGDHTGPLPEIAFLDINMPRIDGVSCLKQIKSDPRYNNMHVIMFSTSSAKVGVEVAYRYGASLYIRKSASFEKTVEMLRDILTRIASKQYRRRKDNFYIA